MPRYATVLHLSDLHLVRNLKIDPHGWQADAMHKFKAKPHSFARLDAFIGAVAAVRASRPIDIVLGTGDLTTNGDETALKLVRDLIDNKNVNYGRPGRFGLYNLDRQGSGRILLPGNHDRYDRDWFPIQRRSDAFERVLFETPPTYPYAVAYRPKTGIPLLFFVFDSTPSESVVYSFLQFLAPPKNLWVEKGSIERDL